MNTGLALLLQGTPSSATGRAAIDAIYAIAYNEIFLGALALMLVAAFIVAMFSRRAGIALALSVLGLGFVGLMSPYLISILRLVTGTSAR